MVDVLLMVDIGVAGSGGRELISHHPPGIISLSAQSHEI